MRAGSILVTVTGSVADLAAAVKDVRDNGLELPSFDALTAMPGMCVYRIGESCYHSLNPHLCYPNHLPFSRHEGGKRLGMPCSLSLYRSLQLVFL